LDHGVSVDDETPKRLSDAVTFGRKFEFSSEIQAAVE
jgi:hypothetical protein